MKRKIATKQPPVCRKADPDPIALIALVVASISMTCDLVNIVRDRRHRAETAKNRKNIQKILPQLMDLEARILDVQAQFNRVRNRLEIDDLNAPMRFGATPAWVDGSELRQLGRETNQLFQVISKFNAVLEKTIFSFYESDLDWESSPLGHLLKIREEANSIIWKSNSIGESLGKVDHMLNETADAIRRVRVWIDLLGK
ncbi:MAG: hypothetical protein RL380_829 [Verrucomicrobiota bacterium]